MMAAPYSGPEPEFSGTYGVITSDTTYALLPKEIGEIKNHESKFAKFARIADIAGDIGSAVGGIGAVAGSVDAVVVGIDAMNAASSVGSVANIAGVLTTSNGKDIVFHGKSSSYVVPSGQDLNLLVKSTSNDIDPLDLFRIVKLNRKKKDRRIQWLQFSPSLLGTDDIIKRGYLSFEGHKYGEKSYIISISGNQVQEGEYGIFLLDIGVGSQIPVGTFSVQ